MPRCALPGLLAMFTVLSMLPSNLMAAIPGDANGDGAVDVADYTAWFNNYGKVGGATLAQGDFNGDGNVDVADYTIWFNNYGKASGQSQVTNLKIVTDGSPDYSDMDSMVRSITSNWSTTPEKCWAMFYWNHIARRQTQPMKLHGIELTDPIMQFNDYGYTMCSTISGINCSIFGYMGLPVNFVDISNHTVMQVGYGDGFYHMHDNSLSMQYRTCDGSRLASVYEIGTTGACSVAPTSTKGHIAKYHAVYGTSPLGFCEGADTNRSLQQMADDFNPNGIKNRTYYNAWSWGHRYVLNLRPNEIYTRTYHVTGSSTNYYVPNPPPSGPDPEAKNTRYHIRGNGQWVFTPALNSDQIIRNTISMTGMDIVASGTGLQPKTAAQTAEAVFKIEGANVITSIAIEGTFKRATSGDVNSIAVSTNNGLTWTDVWTRTSTGTALQTINLCDQVNGFYEVLVKVRLMGQTKPDNAQLTTLKFTTITMINSKTQPMLRLGKNTVYVDRGEQTGSVAIWPDLQNYGYRTYSVDESNVTSAATASGYMGVIYGTDVSKESYVTFKIDTPEAMTKLTYGGRLYNRGLNAHIDFLHSFDGGATWTQSYTLTDKKQPWDVIHYETVTNIPAGCKSALVKYRWSSSWSTGQSVCSIYSVRMEANYRVGDPTFKPMEITYTWKERQTDYSTVTRGHTQLVPSVPYSYTINVGGADHPVMESLQMNQQGSAGPVTYGYSDGIDIGGTKFQDRYVTFGNVLSTGKPYTSDQPSGTQWGAGDTYPNGTKLTDGVVGSSYTGGSTMAFGGQWQVPVNLTMDLGSNMQCGAFRIHVFGYPYWDAMKGQFKDKAEVLTSTDNVNWTSRGFFNFNLRWKDIPVNYMWTDEETFCGHNFEMILPQQITARYVRFKLTPARYMHVSEMQVLDGITYTPFDLKVAPPPAFAGGGK